MQIYANSDVPNFNRDGLSKIEEREKAVKRKQEVRERSGDWRGVNNVGK